MKKACLTGDWNLKINQKNQKQNKKKTQSQNSQPKLGLATSHIH